MSVCLPKFTGTAILVVALFFSSFAVADGIVVNKIYAPYVQPLETEIEWRFVDQRDGVAPDVHKQLIGFGRSFSDRWAAEIYAIGVQGGGESFSVNACELETKWQLTEQGEYAFDWGLLFELERDFERNAWEVSTHLLAARDFGRLTVTGNLGLIYEDGERVQGEIESTLRLQARYRLKETFEPALELHVGQNTTAIGPLISGLFRFGVGKKLLWELGVFAGVSKQSPDRIVKANIEFEF